MAAPVDHPAQRIIEAAEHLPPGGAVTGWESLHLAGARYFEGYDARGGDVPVHLAHGSHVRRRVPAGLRVSRHALARDEVDVRCGIPCTSVLRAVRDEVRTRDVLWEAVSAVDSSTTLSRGESPQETWLRLVWTRIAGLPPPLVNRNVYDLSGRFLARPDLLEAADGFVGEYDGDHHRDTAQRRGDVGREDLLRSAGLEYVSVVGGEKDEREVAARILRTRARAQAGSLPRAWTLDPPHGRPDLTLEERICLREQHGLPLAGSGFAAPERYG